jgi:Bacterial membrane protein YfhO
MHSNFASPQQSEANHFSGNVSHALWVFLGFSALYIVFFSPILFSEKLLAPGDGIVYYIPALYSPKTLWTDLIFGGYPIAADPQNQTWYPLSFLFNSTPKLWNAYVVIAYVLAASFSYCYMYIVTRSRLAAIATGIVYSMSGYMMAHLGHLTMIHAAAWIPLILCAFEALRHRFDRKWFAIGVGAIACCFLSGHPQIPVYGIGLGTIYAVCLGWSAPVGRWRYYKVAVPLLVLGLAVCALQILPTLELSRLSLRAELTFQEFSAYSVPPWQALQFVFPYLFMVLDQTGRPSLYWGEWGLTELANYSGLLSLLLGSVGFIAYRSRPLAWFWLVVGVLTLLFTFGDGTPLGYVLYHTPVYKMFRAQGRHAVEVALAVSILAGFGVASIQQNLASNRLVKLTIGIGAGLMLGSLGVMALQYQFLAERAAKVLTSFLNLTPWENPVVGIPLVVFVTTSVILYFWSRSTRSAWFSVALIGVLIIDLASFGWFYEWKYDAFDTTMLVSNPEVKPYQESLQANHQRILAPRGADFLDEDTIPPNLSRLWKISSIGGYTPLTLSRTSKMLQMGASGFVFNFPPSESDRSFDLMSVRYLFVPPPLLRNYQGIFWDSENLSISLGSGSCAAQAHEAISLNVPELPDETTDIGIVTNMGCSPEITDQTAVLQVQVTDTDGKVETQNLLAGRDTSEWAYSCPDIKPFVKHQQATVFESFPTQREGAGECAGQSYVAMLKLKQPTKIKNLNFKWTGLPGVLTISQMSLINQEKQTSAAFISRGLSPNLEDAERWRYVENLGQTTVYENLQAMPRAWLVSEGVSFKRPAGVLRAIQSSRLSDGRLFEPEKTALFERIKPFKYPELQPTDLVKVVNIADTQVEIQTETASRAFLVLSDVYYPGWKATIDGRSTRVFRTNYLQRGVKVPAGVHTVKFEFRPTSFSLGAGISTASLFVFGLIVMPKGLFQKIRLSKK